MYKDEEITQYFIQTRREYVEAYMGYLEAHSDNLINLIDDIPNIFQALDIAYERKMLDQLIRGANSLFQFLESRGLYSEATRYLEKAELAARELEDWSGLSRSLYHLGQIARKKGDFVQAEQFWLEGLNIARQKKDCDEVTSDLLNVLGELFFAMGKPAQARDSFEESLNVAEAIKVRVFKKVSSVLQNIGMLEHETGNRERAWELYQQSLGISQEIGDLTRTQALLTTLGVASVGRGDYSEARKYHQQALSLAQELQHYERIMVSLFNLGSVAMRQGDYTLAKECWSEADTIAETIGNSERQSYALMLLGNVFQTQSHYETAKDYLLKGLSIARKIGNTQTLFYLLTNLGEVEFALENYSNAATYWNESRQIAEDTGHSWSKAYIYYDLGLLNLRQNEIEASLFMFEETLRISQTISNTELMGIAKYGMAQAEKQRGDFSKARELAYESLEVLKSIGHHLTNEIQEWLSNLVG